MVTQPLVNKMRKKLLCLVRNIIILKPKENGKNLYAEVPDDYVGLIKD